MRVEDKVSHEKILDHKKMVNF